MTHKEEYLNNIKVTYECGKCGSSFTDEHHIYQEKIVMTIDNDDEIIDDLSESTITPNYKWTCPFHKHATMRMLITPLFRIEDDENEKTS